MSVVDKPGRSGRLNRIGASFVLAASGLSSLLTRGGEQSATEDSLDWLGMYASTAVGGLMAGVDTGLVCGGIYWLLWRLQRHCG